MRTDQRRLAANFPSSAVESHFPTLRDSYTDLWTMATRAQTLRKASASRAQATTSDVDSAQKATTTSTEKDSRANGSAGASAALKQEQTKSSAATTSHGKTRKMYCSCRQPDNGSPMILCSECNEWCAERLLRLQIGS